MRVPWTARRSNQSILKEINPKYSLEGLVLNLGKLREMVRDREAWCAAVHGVKRSWTKLGD